MDTEDNGAVKAFLSSLGTNQTSVLFQQLHLKQNKNKTKTVKQLISKDISSKMHFSEKACMKMYDICETRLPTLCTV